MSGSPTSPSPFSKSAYLKRLVIGGAAAVVITFAIGILVMWISGFVIDDEPSRASLTPCVFGEQKSAPLENPFAKQPIGFDCIAPEDAKPLFVQWFDRILSRRAPDGGGAGAAGR